MCPLPIIHEGQKFKCQKYYLKGKKNQMYSKWDIIKASQNFVINKIKKLEQVTLQHHKNKNIIKISICKNIFGTHSWAISYSGLDA